MDSELDPGRTYVVLRWTRDFWADRPSDEVMPLGTVRAGSLRQARAQARGAWPGVPTATLRVRRVSACRPGVLIDALAADGVRRRPADA